MEKAYEPLPLEWIVFIILMNLKYCITLYIFTSYEESI